MLLFVVLIVNRQWSIHWRARRLRTKEVAGEESISHHEEILSISNHADDGIDILETWTKRLCRACVCVCLSRSINKKCHPRQNSISIGNELVFFDHWTEAKTNPIASEYLPRKRKHGVSSDLHLDHQWDRSQLGQSETRRARRVVVRPILFDSLNLLNLIDAGVYLHDRSENAQQYLAIISIEEVKPLSMIAGKSTKWVQLDTTPRIFPRLN